MRVWGNYSYLAATSYSRLLSDHLAGISQGTSLMKTSLARSVTLLYPLSHKGHQAHCSRFLNTRQSDHQSSNHTNSRNMTLSYRMDHRNCVLEFHNDILILKWSHNLFCLLHVRPNICQSRIPARSTRIVVVCFFSTVCRTLQAVLYFLWSFHMPEK